MRERRRRQKMRRGLTACLLFGLILWTSTAYGESTKGALSAFGLIGRWSADCSKDPSADVVVASPFLGTPTFKLGRDAPLQITEAKRVTEGKILLVLDDDRFKGWRVVFRKEGSKIQIYETSRVAGEMQSLIQNGMMGRMPAPVLEKCLLHYA